MRPRVARAGEGPVSTAARATTVPVSANVVRARMVGICCSLRWLCVRRSDAVSAGEERWSGRAARTSREGPYGGLCGRIVSACGWPSGCTRTSEVVVLCQRRGKGVPGARPRTAAATTAPCRSWPPPCRCCAGSVPARRSGPGSAGAAGTPSPRRSTTRTATGCSPSSRPRPIGPAGRGMGATPSGLRPLFGEVHGRAVGRGGTGLERRRTVCRLPPGRCRSRGGRGEAARPLVAPFLTLPYPGAGR